MSNLRSFYWRRVARVYPLYLVIFFVALFFGARAVNWTTGFLQVTLLHGYFQGMASVVPPSWSLTVEMAFYLMAPWLLWLCAMAAGRFRQAWLRVGAQAVALGVVTVILLAIGLVMRALSMRYLEPTAAGYQFVPTASYMLFGTVNGFFGMFAAGILLALLLHETDWLERIYTRRTLSLVVCVVALVTMVGLLHLSRVGEYRQTEVALYLTYLGFGLCTCALIVGLMNPAHMLSRLFSLPLLVYLGHISYAFYLIQMNAWFNGLAWRPSITLFPEREPLWLYMLVLYVLANLVSAALYEFVEKPLHRLMTGRPAQWTQALQPLLRTKTVQQPQNQ
ncbi:MAG: acyltransferase [Chloroflexota bacterium]